MKLSDISNFPLDNRILTIYHEKRLSFHVFMLKGKVKNRMREFRKQKRMKQVVLAKEVGVFQSEISEIETGDRKPNIYLARKIAKAFGKSVDEIF